MSFPDTPIRSSLIYFLLLRLNIAAELDNACTLESPQKVKLKNAMLFSQAISDSAHLKSDYIKQAIVYMKRSFH